MGATGVNGQPGRAGKERKHRAQQREADRLRREERFLKRLEDTDPETRRLALKIMEVFPGMSIDDLDFVLFFAGQEGAVGDPHLLRGDPSPNKYRKAAYKAVWSYARHNYSPYTQILLALGGGEDAKREARMRVKPMIKEVVTGWMTGGSLITARHGFLAH